MKILLVDDEDLARARLLRMLSTLGHTDITQASNASEALVLARDLNPGYQTFSIREQQ